MVIHQLKKYFGIVGSNQETVTTIYNCLTSKINTKIIPSLDDISTLNSSLGAIAYVMDYPSAVHSYNLEHIYQNSANKPLYIISNQISIPLLHHALRMGFRDVFKLPFDNKAVDKLSLEVSETTKIESTEHAFLPSCFIPPPEELINHPLEKLFDIIEQNFVDTPSLLQVSNRIYLSPSRISHMFKDLCGIGYSQYLLCRRLEESEYLLSQENAIITNISFDVGFSNPSHFCRSFKEHLGLTPTAYIKKASGGKLSCLYQRYQTLRMELLPVLSIKQHNLRLLANS